MPTAPTLALNTALLKPGIRLGIAISGGADSVALLRALIQQSRELGLILYAAHLHHGLRGAEADADLAFCRDLAASLEIPFHSASVDTTAESRAGLGKPAESIEEAARRLRYSWFRQLLTQVPLDAIATAHTLDDQAETVLAKFLRGAWTEGLSGIYPILEFQEGRIVRPLLCTARSEIEAYLRAIGQSWREDSSNRHLAFTRNRIRHELLPQLETWNPQLRRQLAQMAELAREEQAWWENEVARIAPQFILPGRPVRGGGHASAGDGLALDIMRLADLPPALQRRLIRHAAGQLGSALDFDATEVLRKLALEGRAGQSHSASRGLRGERTHRELRLSIGSATGPSKDDPDVAVSEYVIPIPGESVARAFGMRLRIESEGSSSAESSNLAPRQAVLRPWKAGDRVRLRHSAGPRKVKEVLERLRITGPGRVRWPVLEFDGRIIWMQGVEVEPEPGIQVFMHTLSEGPL